MDLFRAKDKLKSLPSVDVDRMRTDRLNRLQAEMGIRDIGGMLLYDPINIRYAADCRNMQIWTMHNSARYCLVPAEGKITLLDFLTCSHLSSGIETILESRPGILWMNHLVGPNRQDLIESWADDLVDAIKHQCPNNRIVYDRLDSDGRNALEQRQIDVSFGQDIIEYARSVKTPEELKAQLHSAFVCETALKEMKKQTVPGISENDLWSILVYVNSILGGDYIETKLVVSGSNTNPWMNEASERKIQAGELLGIDTDMIGPFGYNTDISRTWLCHPGTPTDEQKTLYKMSYEQIHHNISLLKAGLSFREFSEKAWKMPTKYSKLDGGAIVHGTGMCNEYPVIWAPHLFAQTGYDGYFEENMTISVESYIGEAGGSEGVKLEEMVRITDSGAHPIAQFPFEDELLAL